VDDQCHKLAVGRRAVELFTVDRLTG